MNIEEQYRIMQEDIAKADPESQEAVRMASSLLKSFEAVFGAAAQLAVMMRAMELAMESEATVAEPAK